MSLSPGQRLGAFEVVAPLGAGGMGEVYRARDVALKREVALKVLPTAMAADPDRLARFRREAEVLASLNHPHIAQVYGLEQAGETSALVLELVEGEDLAERLARGALAPAEALPIALQVADALEAAHDAGVVHRDLKPANIKVRPDGTVKVLDFGLAKAVDNGAGRRAYGSGSHAESGTVTSPAVTRDGVILGTAAYMSPEQARGRLVDKRTDIWAFGVVLYEMLTGRCLFGRETLTDTLAAVLTADPDLALLPPSTPPAVVTLVRRCLDRDARTRLRDIGEARIALSTPLVTAAPPATPIAVPRNRRSLRLVWLVAALPVAAALSVLFWRNSSEDRQDTALLRLGIAAGGDTALAGTGWAGLNWVGPTVAIAPDGASMVFIARGSGGGRWQLYLRRLDELRATPLPGTEGASAPFFSPDGESVGFFANRRLLTISLTSRTVTPLAPIEDGRGGAWAADGTIVFVPAPSGGLWRVSAAGGDPTPVTTIDENSGATTHRWPQVLPGGTHVLYTAQDDGSASRDGSIEVQPLAGGPRTVLHRGGLYGRYVPTGHLLFLRDATLFAMPFDLSRLQVTGQPVPVVDDVAFALINGTAQYAVSDTGTLVYRRKSSIRRLLQWMDVSGQFQTIRELPAEYQELRFSPDGTRALLVIGEGAQSDVWLYELADGRMSRLTFHPDNDWSAVWSPDGKYVAYGSWRADVAAFNLFVHRADGTGEPQRLTTSRNGQLPVEWHPSGRYLLFTEERRDAGLDVMSMPMEPTPAGTWHAGEPRVFVGTAANEASAQFSPDGRWVAYTSDESGRNEVYVQPFPGPGGRWQVSTEGAEWVEWYKDVMYGRSEEVVMSVPYRVAGNTFAAERPRVWMRIPPGVLWLDPAPDSSRAAVIRSEEGRGESLVLVVNFFDHLRRQVMPVGR